LPFLPFVLNVNMSELPYNVGYVVVVNSSETGITCLRSLSL